MLSCYQIFETQLLCGIQIRSVTHDGGDAETVYAVKKCGDDFGGKGFLQTQFPEIPVVEPGMKKAEFIKQRGREFEGQESDFFKGGLK